MTISALQQMQGDLFAGIVSLATFCLALVVAITFHEFSHAATATLQGDSTPRRQGRLSLYPIAHLDPLGTAMILLAGFGWGKPVQVDPRGLSAGPRSGMALVSLAGPLSNLVLAFAVAIPINAGVVSSRAVGIYLFSGGAADFTEYVIGSLITWNLVLAAFNLIPLAPLDGFKIALGILPRDAAYRFAQLERYGPAILMLVIMLEFMLPGPGILGSVIRPLIDALASLILGGHP